MGAINLDNTGSGGAVTLTSDGTSLLLGGTAVGGALELYAENPVSAEAPTARANNSVAIGSSADTYSNDTIAIGTETISSGSGSSAVGHLAKSQGSSSGSFGYGSWAAGQYGMAIGRAYAGGSNSFAAVITDSTSTYGAQGANSIAIGYRAKAAGQSSAMGYGAVADGSYALALGVYAKASASSSIAISGETSGYYTEASQSKAVAIGVRAKAAIRGKFAFANGAFGDNGDAQLGIFSLRSDTTDATAEALTTDKGTAGTTNQIVLPNSSAYAFHGTIVARQKASEGTASAAWKIEGLIRREANAGTTVLVNSATTVLDNTPAWGMALTADTTNGCLKIEVTGAASTNIRWVATINTSELTYA